MTEPDQGSPVKPTTSGLAFRFRPNEEELEELTIEEDKQEEQKSLNISSLLETLPKKLLTKNYSQSDSEDTSESSKHSEWWGEESQWVRSNSFVESLTPENGVRRRIVCNPISDIKISRGMTSIRQIQGEMESGIEIGEEMLSNAESPRRTNVRGSASRSSRGARSTFAGSATEGPVDSSSAMSEAVRGVIKYCVPILAASWFRIPEFWSGVVFGVCFMGLTEVLWNLIRAVLIDIQTITVEKGPFNLPNYNIMPPLTVPSEPLLIKRSCFNLYTHPYDPDTYSVNQTKPVCLELHGSILKITRVKSKMTKRAHFSQTFFEVDPKRCAEYDLQHCTVKLLPEGLARKRLFSKKYPIAINLRKKALMNNTKNVEERFYYGYNFSDKTLDVRLEKREDEARITDDSEIVSEYEKNRSPILYLFSRCDRDKEDWYRWLLAASNNNQPANSDPSKGNSDDTDFSEYVTRDEEKKEKENDDKKDAVPSSTSDKKDDDAPLCELDEYILCLSKYVEMPRRLISPTLLAREADLEMDFDSLDVQWLNALIGRLTFDIFRSAHWCNKIQEKLQKKLSSLKLPYYVEEMEITEMDLGRRGPTIHRVSRAVIDERGLWFDLDLSHRSPMRVTIQTKLNLQKLQLGTKVKEEARKNPLFDSEAEDTAESSTEDDSSSPGVHADVSKGSKSSSKGNKPSKKDSVSSKKNSATSEKEIVASKKDSAASKKESVASDSNTGIPVKQKKLPTFFRIVENVANSRAFRHVAQTKMVQRVIVGVSQTKLRLQVNVSGIIGTMAVNIPPPPSDRIWYGFRGMPKIWLKATPLVGDWNVNLSHVTSWIERKLIREFQHIVVLPNMKCILLSPGYTENEKPSSTPPTRVSLDVDEVDISGFDEMLGRVIRHYTIQKSVEEGLIPLEEVAKLEDGHTLLETTADVTLNVTDDLLSTSMTDAETVSEMENDNDPGYFEVYSDTCPLSNMKQLRRMTAVLEVDSESFHEPSSSASGSNRPKVCCCRNALRSRREATRDDSGSSSYDKDIEDLSNVVLEIDPTCICKRPIKKSDGTLSDEYEIVCNCYQPLKKNFPYSEDSPHKKFTNEENDYMDSFCSYLDNRNDKSLSSALADPRTAPMNNNLTVMPVEEFFPDSRLSKDVKVLKSSRKTVAAAVLSEEVPCVCKLEDEQDNFADEGRLYAEAVAMAHGFAGVLVKKDEQESNCCCKNSGKKCTIVRSNTNCNCSKRKPRTSEKSRSERSDSDSEVQNASSAFKSFITGKMFTRPSQDNRITFTGISLDSRDSMSSTIEQVMANRRYSTSRASRASKSALKKKLSITIPNQGTCVMEVQTEERKAREVKNMESQTSSVCSYYEHCSTGEAQTSLISPNSDTFEAVNTKIGLETQTSFLSLDGSRANVAPVNPIFKAHIQTQTSPLSDSISSVYLEKANVSIQTSEIMLMGTEDKAVGICEAVQTTDSLFDHSDFEQQVSLSSILDDTGFHLETPQQSNALNPQSSQPIISNLSLRPLSSVPSSKGPITEENEFFELPQPQEPLLPFTSSYQEICPPVVKNGQTQKNPIPAASLSSLSSQETLSDNNPFRPTTPPTSVVSEKDFDPSPEIKPLPIDVSDAFKNDRGQKNPIPESSLSSLSSLKTLSDTDPIRPTAPPTSVVSEKDFDPSPETKPLPIDVSNAFKNAAATKSFDRSNSHTPHVDTSSSKHQIAPISPPHSSSTVPTDTAIPGDNFEIPDVLPLPPDNRILPLTTNIPPPAIVIVPAPLPVSAMPTELVKKPLPPPPPPFILDIIKVPKTPEATTSPAPALKAVAKRPPSQDKTLPQLQTALPPKSPVDSHPQPQAESEILKNPQLKPSFLPNTAERSLPKSEMSSQSLPQAISQPLVEKKSIFIPNPDSHFEPIKKIEPLSTEQVPADAKVEVVKPKKPRKPKPKKDVRDFGTQKSPPPYLSKMEEDIVDDSTTSIPSSILNTTKTPPPTTSQKVEDKTDPLKIINPTTANVLATSGPQKSPSNAPVVVGKPKSPCTESHKEVEKENNATASNTPVTPSKTPHCIKPQRRAGKDKTASAKAPKISKQQKSTSPTMPLTEEGTGYVSVAVNIPLVVSKPKAPPPIKLQKEDDLISDPTSANLSKLFDTTETSSFVESTSTDSVFPLIITEPSFVEKQEEQMGESVVGGKPTSSLPRGGNKIGRKNCSCRDKNTKKEAHVKRKNNHLDRLRKLESLKEEEKEKLVESKVKDSEGNPSGTAADSKKSNDEDFAVL